MADIVSEEQRSWNMSQIGGKDTKPELLIRKALHRAGYRFRVNDSTLPGKPDMKFPRFKALIQIHGCFWHGHNCPLFKWPENNREFWHEKISGNMARDHKHSEELYRLGWRLLVVWECSLKGKYRLNFNQLMSDVESWLQSDVAYKEITGNI